MKTRFALGTILIATQIEFPKSCTIDFFKDLLAPPIEVFCLFVCVPVCVWVDPRVFWSDCTFVAVISIFVLCIYLSVFILC